MTDINIGAISEALNNKVDLPTPSTPQDAVDYVIEKQDPTSANGYTWYRKYKSGWVEQGGTGTSHQYNTTARNVTFPIIMQDTKYQVLLVAGETTQQSWDFGVRVGIRYTNGLDVRGGTNSNSAYNGPFFWQVSGYEA